MSLSVSGILLFFKTLSKFFNNIDGSISSLGYIAIFIYTTTQFITSVKSKKFVYNKIYLKYALVFIIVYLLSLGDFFLLNNFIYKAVPFLESFRAPERFMKINTFCTLMLFAFAFEEIKKKNFKIDNIYFVFILIFLIFILAFFHYSRHFHTRTDIDLSNWRDVFVISYPFLIIIFSFIILNSNFFRKKALFIIISFVTLSIIENVFIMNRFVQYSLFFEKDIIKNNILKAENICKKYDTNSINIVGEFKETENEFYYNFKKFNYKSILSSKNCKVFYHHNRLDLVKRGLGYNQSSLSTYQMSHLSNYQYDFLEKNFVNFSDFEFKYIASLLQYFTNSKVFYILEGENKLKDDLFEFEDEIINKFIKDYFFEKKKNIFEKLKKNKIISSFIFNSNLIGNYFPNKSINQFKLKKIDNHFFLPVWQDDNFYIKKNKHFFLVKDFSFGKKINLEDVDKKIYYMPISFIIGIIVTLFSLIILFASLISIIYRK